MISSNLLKNCFIIDDKIITERKRARVKDKDFYISSQKGITNKKLENKYFIKTHIVKMNKSIKYLLLLKQTTHSE